MAEPVKEKDLQQGHMWYLKMSRAFTKIFSIPFGNQWVVFFVKCQGTEWLWMNGVLCTRSWLQTYCFYVFVYFEPYNL